MSDHHVIEEAEDASDLIAFCFSAGGILNPPGIYIKNGELRLELLEKLCGKEPRKLVQAKDGTTLWVQKYDKDIYGDVPECKTLTEFRAIFRRHARRRHGPAWGSTDDQTPQYFRYLGFVFWFTSEEKPEAE
jgi:hypothetical protein